MDIKQGSMVRMSDGSAQLVLRINFRTGVIFSIDRSQCVNKYHLDTGFPVGYNFRDTQEAKMLSQKYRVRTHISNDGLPMNYIVKVMNTPEMVAEILDGGPFVGTKDAISSINIFR